MKTLCGKLYILVNCEVWFIYINTHTQTLTHSQTHALTHSCTYTLTHSHTHTLTHSHTHTLTHSRTHTLTHSHTHTLTHSHSHTHALTHSRTHALMHSHTHIHITLLQTQFFFFDKISSSNQGWLFTYLASPILGKLEYIYQQKKRCWPFSFESISISFLLTKSVVSMCNISPKK